MNRRLLFASIVLVALCGGCARSASRAQVLATNLSTLLPHSDRDHFVFATERTAGEKQFDRGLVVEHVSQLDAVGEFQVTESRDGARTGESRWIADDRGISLVSEDLEVFGVRLVYDPPMLVYPEPLLAGEHRATATGTATRLETGTSLGSFDASLVMRSKATRSRHPLAGSGRAVAFEVTRSLASSEGALVIRIESVNSEGVGELESVGILDGSALVVRRSLVCGFIEGRAVGRCEEAR